MSKALSVTEQGVRAIQQIENRIIRRVIKTTERAADDHFWLDDEGVPIQHPDNPFLAEKVDARRLNAAKAMLKDKRSSRVGLEIAVRLMEAEKKAQAAAGPGAGAQLNIAKAVIMVQPTQYETIDVTPGKRGTE